MRAFVNLREALESDIDREHLFDLGVTQQRHVISRLERDGALVTPPLQTRACSGVIHQNAAHRLSRNGEEAVAVRGGELTLLQETEVDLVDEGGGRERVAGRLATKLSAGHLTQLIVDERHQSLQRVVIACAPARKPLCHLAIGHDSPVAGKPRLQRIIAPHLTVLFRAQLMVSHLRDVHFRPARDLDVA